MTAMTTYVLDLRETIDASQAGRKAATLARLLRDGFPVPDGVVLLADALDRALDAAGLTADAPADAVAAIEVPAQIEAALREAVRRWGEGTPLAVRSSGINEDLASASYAGLYSTVLGVTGEDRLLAAVRQCWASAFGQLVRRYGQKATADRPRLAVLIQPMIPATAAGVAFTTDPVTGDRGTIVVEAVRGTGDRLVSGAATPDEWAISGESALRRAGSEDAIDAGVARAVAALAHHVEQYQGEPQDIEWALSGEEVVLLQARPITGVAERLVQPVPVPAEPPPGYWTREASHAPLPWSPFNRAAARPRASGIRKMCERMGLLFETIDFHDIGGWEYVRIVPIGGKDRPVPPARLVPLLFRLVPPLRRRIKSLPCGRTWSDARCVAGTRNGSRSSPTVALSCGRSTSRRSPTQNSTRT